MWVIIKHGQAYWDLNVQNVGIPKRIILKEVKRKINVIYAKKFVNHK